MLGFQNPLVQTSQDDLRNFLLNKSKSGIGQRDVSGYNNNDNSNYSSNQAFQPQLEWRYSFNPVRDSEQVRNQGNVNLNLIEIENILSEDTDNSAVNDSLLSNLCNSGAKQNRTREFCKTSESFALTPNRDKSRNKNILSTQVSTELFQSDRDSLGIQTFARKKTIGEELAEQYNLIRSPIKEKFDITSHELDLENYDPAKDLYLNRRNNNCSENNGNDSMVDNSMYRILSQKNYLCQSPKLDQGEPSQKRESIESYSGLQNFFQRETFGKQDENIPPGICEDYQREILKNKDSYPNINLSNQQYSQISNKYWSNTSNNNYTDLKKSFHKILIGDNAESSNEKSYDSFWQVKKEEKVIIEDNYLRRDQPSPLRDLYIENFQNPQHARDSAIKQSKDCLREIQEREEKFFKDLEKLREDMNKVKSSPIMPVKETRESKFQTSFLPQILEERSSFMQRSTEDLAQASKIEDSVSVDFRGSLTKSEDNNFWNNSSENMFQHCNNASIHNTNLEESYKECNESSDRKLCGELFEVQGVPDFTKKRNSQVYCNDSNGNIYINTGEKDPMDISNTSIEDSGIFSQANCRVPPLFESKMSNVFFPSFTTPFKKEKAREPEKLKLDPLGSSGNNKILNKEDIDEIMMLSEKLESTVKKDKRERSRTPERRNIFKSNLEKFHQKGRYTVTETDEPVAFNYNDKLSKSSYCQISAPWEDHKKSEKSSMAEIKINNEHIISEMKPETEADEIAEVPYSLTSFENLKPQESVSTSQIIQNNQERQNFLHLDVYDNYQFVDGLRKRYDISYSASQYNISYEKCDSQHLCSKNSSIYGNSVNVSRDIKNPHPYQKALFANETNVKLGDQRKNPSRIFTNNDFKEVFYCMEKKYNYVIENFETEGEELIKEVFCMDCEDYIKRKDVDNHSNICYQSLTKEIQGYWTLTAKERKKLASNDELIRDLNVKLGKIKTMVEEKLALLGNEKTAEAIKLKDGVLKEINSLLRITDNIISNQFFSKQIFLSLTQIDNINSFLNNLKDKRVSVNFIILTNRLKLLCKEKAAKLKEIEDQVLSNLSFCIEENDEITPQKTEFFQPQPGKVLARIKLPKNFAKNKFQSLTAIHSDCENSDSRQFSCSEGTNNSISELEISKSKDPNKQEFKLATNLVSQEPKRKEFDEPLGLNENEENGKREFYAEAVRIKLSLPRNHPGRDLLISNLYEECFKRKLKRESWQAFIQGKFKMCE